MPAAKPKKVSDKMAKLIERKIKAMGYGTEAANEIRAAAGLPAVKPTGQTAAASG